MRARTRSILLASALAAGAAVGARAAPCNAQAGAAENAAVVRFNRGRQMFMAQDYEHALEEFRAALSLVGSPNTRLYIGRCLHALNRNAEALVEFQRAAAEAADRAAREPRYAGTRDAARTEAAAVEPLVGSLVVRVPHPPPGVTVSVNGAPVLAAGWDVPIPYDPGNLEVTATAQGFEPFRQSVAVTAAHEASVTIELAAMSMPPPAHTTPPPDQGATPAGTGGPGPGPGAGVDHERPPGPVEQQPVPGETHMVGGGLRTAGIGVVVVGVLGAGAFGVFGYLAQSRYSDLQTQCGQAGCGPQYDGQISEGQTFQTVANVGLVVGAVGLVAGAVMIAVGGPHPEPAPSPGSSTRNAARERPRHARGGGWSLWGAPAVNNTGGVLGVVGAF